MTIARHAGAVLIVSALIVALMTISPGWPVVVVGLVGGFLFAVAELDELASWWRAHRHDSRALRFAQKTRSLD